MQAAIYSRFSTDKQNESSIEDQVRNCIRHAERMQIQVIQEYADKAISGTSKSRPGFKDMLAAAERGEFEVLLVDDLSRLSRDEVETKQVIRKFKFRRQRIIGVSDGYDSNTKGEKIQSTMRGLINEMYIDDLREKTHRGLYGKAMKGFSAGGRTYGYKRSPIENPAKLDVNGRPEIIAVRREINEEEARWVRQSFEWFVAGHTPKRIAAELNRLAVPSARGGTWTASSIYGDMTKGDGMLNNEIYIGKYLWNRSEWIKNPDSGKRKRLDRKASERVVVELPELRIVPQELWDAAKARQHEIREKSAALRKALNNPNSRSHTGKYLFSGLLKCGCCGANFTIWGSTSYACAGNVHRGDTVCSNRLRVPRRIVEERLVEAINEDLFSDEAVDLLIKETSRHLKQMQEERTPESEAAQQRLEEAERTINNLMTAIKAGIITPTTKAELEQAEAEQARAKVALQTCAVPTDNLIALLPRAAGQYRALLKNLRDTLQRDSAQARQCLKTLVGDIRLLPQGKVLFAELQRSVDGLISLAARGGPLNIRLVAGVGFEPTTFRL